MASLFGGLGRVLIGGGAAGAAGGVGGFLSGLGAEMLAPMARDMLFGAPEQAAPQPQAGAAGVVGGPTNTAGGITAAGRAFAPTTVTPAVDPTPTFKEMSAKLDGVIVAMNKVEGRIVQQTQQQTENAKAVERSARETSLEGASTVTPGGAGINAMGMIQGAGLVGLVGAGALAAASGLSGAMSGDGQSASDGSGVPFSAPDEAASSSSTRGRNASEFSDVVLGGRLTSGRGMRDGKYHTGVDIAAPQGTPIKAIAAGRCTRVSRDTPPYRGFGNIVIIDHGDGWQTVYAHLAAASVRRSQRVSIGDQIGTVGNTGISTGPHLHLILQRSGFAVPNRENTAEPSTLLRRARDAARDGGERVESPGPVERATRAVGDAVEGLIDRGREIFTPTAAEAPVQPSPQPLSQPASFANLPATDVPANITPTENVAQPPMLMNAVYNPNTTLAATPVALAAVAPRVVERARPAYRNVVIEQIPRAANDNPRVMADYLRRQLTLIKTANPEVQGQHVRTMLARAERPLVALEGRLASRGRGGALVAGGIAVFVAGLIAYTYTPLFNIDTVESSVDQILSALGFAPTVPQEVPAPTREPETRPMPGPVPDAPAPAPAPAPDRPRPAPVPVPVPLPAPGTVPTPSPDAGVTPAPGPGVAPAPGPGVAPAPESAPAPGSPTAEVPPPPPPPLPVVPFTLPTPSTGTGRGPPPVERRWGSSPGLTFRQREVDTTRATGVNRGSGMLGLGGERPLTGRLANPQIVERPFLVPLEGSPDPIPQPDMPFAPVPGNEPNIFPVAPNIAPAIYAVDNLSREMSRRQISAPDRGAEGGYTPPRSQAPTPSDVSSHNAGLLGVSDIPAVSAYDIVREYQVYFLGVAAQSNSF